MAKGVASDALGDARSASSGRNSFLQVAFIRMMTAEDTGHPALVPALTPGPSPGGRREGAGVDGGFRGRENILPDPFAGGVGVFALQGIGHVNHTEAVFQVLLVNGTHGFQVLLQGEDEAGWEHGNPIFSPHSTSSG